MVRPLTENSGIVLLGRRSCLPGAKRHGKIPMQSFCLLGPKVPLGDTLWLLGATARTPRSPRWGPRNDLQRSQDRLVPRNQCGGSWERHSTALGAAARAPGSAYSAANTARCSAGPYRLTQSRLQMASGCLSESTLLNHRILLLRARLSYQFNYPKLLNPKTFEFRFLRYS